MYKIIFGLSLVLMVASCAEELPFETFEELNYGAYPRLIDGPNGGFDFEDAVGSGIDFTVEFYDENNGNNVESFKWEVEYTDKGRVELGTWSKSDFGSSPDGLPSLTVSSNFQNVMNALGMGLNDIVGGENFNFYSTVTKSDGSSFALENTGSNIISSASFAGFFFHAQNVLNLPCTSDLGGSFEAAATSTSVAAGIGWDDCAGNAWDGTVRWEAQHDPAAFGKGFYKVYTNAPDGTDFEDVSMGAFYACYESDLQSSMPNGDLQIAEECGKMTFTGASQWGEIYSFSGVTVDGATLTLAWDNDYGEAGEVALTRTDGKVWPDDLRN